MPASPARRAALNVLRRVNEQGAYADRALHGESKELDARDRALAKRLAFGTVQRRATLDWIVARHVDRKLEPQVRAALQLGLYQLLYTDVPQHAAVAESVELAKPSPGAKLVNAVLRKVLREGVELPADDNPKGAAIRHSHPEWLTLLWWDWLGAEEARALLAADNEPTELALRVNPLAGVDVDLAGRREDDALVVEGALDVLSHPLYAAGAITPQSRASQLVARAVDPQPGERILDLCAAPGGKTTHLAALMGDQGEVVAVERHPQRAQALMTQAGRMHATSVRVQVADAKDVSAELLGGMFDRVLVDPPCSGLGTLSSHPDLRWHATPESIEELRIEQEAIVAAARGVLAPGGRLVYSTCTLSPREEIVDGTVVRTLPHRDKTDGFYIAVNDG
ncbi:MAG TPA: 16S rRNA (cytosine(967)-C(5))-methyltransferase RsmB [Baekduia sp.]|uniref:16S rRNA (cytosine(967)-C(5))-methyltransferase RsmB n=1 Tax=Baekduia sp. TaxID=2600305 RepID=UPI002B5E19EF|nr:16S rRNA (cytosine(967)-C(5))-methyltransferase RsmB [Baekduia sp.]HMJ37229.1 16S rRNA (cytosine(967)-C(5))-methyltransferase RsmB [Baekduia sp.]